MIAPTLTGTAGNAHNDLDWNAVAGAVKYRLRRATGTGGYGALYTGPATAFKNTGLVNGTIYHYRVRGVDAKGNGGPWSNVVDLTPRAVVVLPFVGYGDQVTGGDAEKARPMIVRSWADLKAALAVQAVRYIQESPSAGVLDGLGEKLKFTSGDFTLDGTGWGGSIKSGWLLGNAPGPEGLRNVKIIEQRIRPGDQVKAVSDCDAISFHSIDGPIEGILIDRCSLMWGSDIGGATFLSNLTGYLVRNVTMMRSINGPGLKLSAHGEVDGSGDHAKTSNVTTLPSDVIKAMSDAQMQQVPGCERLTFYRDLYFGGGERSPQIQWASLADLINCVTYNWWGGGAVEGNSRSVNIVGHVAVAGPETTTAYKRHFYMHDPKPGQTSFADSIYIEDPLCIGFAYANNDMVAGVLRSTPAGGGLSVPRSLILPSAQVLEAVLAEVGPTIRDSVDASLIAAVRNRTNTVYNGAGFPPPNPTW